MAAAEETPARLDGGPGVVVESRIVCPRAGDDTIPRDGPDGEGWRAGMTAEELAELAELAAAAKLDCGPPPNMGDVPSPEEEVAPEIGPRPNLFNHRPTEIDRSNVVVTMPAIGRNASRTAWKLGHVSRP